MTFAERARALRTKLELSQEQMGDRLAVSRVTIIRWESGAFEPRGEILQDFELLESGKVPCPHCHGTGLVDG